MQVYRSAAARLGVVVLALGGSWVLVAAATAAAAISAAGRTRTWRSTFGPPPARS